MAWRLLRLIAGATLTAASLSAFSAQGLVPPPLPVFKGETPTPLLPPSIQGNSKTQANLGVAKGSKPVEAGASCPSLKLKEIAVSSAEQKVAVPLPKGWRACLWAVQGDEWLSVDSSEAGILLDIAHNETTEDREGQVQIFLSTRKVHVFKVKQKGGNTEFLPLAE